VINRDNSFDLIRHLAALAVLVSHHYVLSGLQEPMLNDYNSLGAIAVLVFFAISGLLITQSFLNTPSLYRYMEKRIARIFPALIACAFVMVYILGTAFSKKGGLSFALSLEALTDFLKMSALGRADIGDITSDFIFKDSFNGSLWTLKIEFGFYVTLAVALIVLRKAATPLVMTLVFCILAYFCTKSTHPIAPKLLVYSTVGIAFFVGSTLYFYRNAFSSTKAKLLIGALSAALVLVSLNTPLVMVLASIGVSLLTLSIGTLCKDQIIKSRFDISYGMYLYAFPVQQLMINATDLGFYASMLATAVVVVILATISWLFIEKPALNYVHAKSLVRSDSATAT